MAIKTFIFYGFSSVFSDVFANSYAGYLTDASILVETAKLLKEEKDYIVWETALNDLIRLRRVFALHPLYAKVVKFEEWYTHD
jgi:hypothetical protein